MKGLQAEPIRISLEGSDEWIAIKPKLSRGDRDWLQNQLIEINLTAEGKSDSSLKTLATETLLLEAAIVDWHLLTDGGTEYKFSRGKIKNLPENDPLVDKVYDEIVDRNPILPTAPAVESGDTS